VYLNRSGDSLDKYMRRKPVYIEHVEPVRQLLASAKGATYMADTLRVSRSTLYNVKKVIEDEGRLDMGQGSMESACGAL